jgi:hypothetical protein
MSREQRPPQRSADDVIERAGPAAGRGRHSPDGKRPDGRADGRAAAAAAEAARGGSDRSRARAAAADGAGHHRDGGRHDDAHRSPVRSRSRELHHPQQQQQQVVAAGSAEAPAGGVAVVMTVTGRMPGTCSARRLGCAILSGALQRLLLTAVGGTCAQR